MAFRNGHSPELLQRLINGTSDLIAALDQDYCFLAFNTAYREEFERIFGARPEIGESLTDALAHLPEDQDRAVELWRRALAGEEFATVSAFGDPERHRKIFEINYHTLRDDDGQIFGAAHVVHDVTARVRAEEKVRRLNEALERKVSDRTAQLDGLINQMTEGLVVFDPEGHLLSMNPAALAIHGFDDDASLKRHLDELAEAVFALYDLDGNELPTEQWPIGRVLAGETFDSYEVRVRRLDTGRTWIGSYGGTMVRNDAGEPLLAIVTLRDITDHHQTREEVRKSEERFRQLADAMPQLVWTAKPDGTVDYYNRRHEEYAGIAQDNATNGWHWSPTLHPDDLQPTVEAWRQAVASGEGYEIEHRVKLADGGYRWHLSRGVPAHDNSGKVVKWYGTATDIEEQKRAEMALRQADHRKNEFLAVLGHELRNPLAAIANGIRVVERGGEEASQALGMVHRHAAQMARLLDDLLDISRITRGKLRVEPSVQSLEPILLAAINAVRPHIDKFGHHLELGEVPDVVVDADATRLEQVFSNLLDNAASYTPPGGRIAVWVEVADAHISVHVADNGRGIKPEDIDEIFEPFRQAEGRQERGLGIGLALVQQLVELHDGTIHVHSGGLGTGSEFVVELPLATADLEGDQSEAACARPARLDGRRVLAIDDNVDAAHFMAVLLRDIGCEVEVASTGQSGLASAREQDFDVILLDIGLPDMNGREVARRLRQMPQYKNARIVAVSGYNQDRDVAASREAGIDAHLGKPASPDALRAAIVGEEPPVRAPGLAQAAQPPSGATLVGADLVGADTHAETLPLVRQLAHDFRSPLSTVQYSSVLLDQQADQPKIRDIASRLTRASDKLAQLVDHALSFVELEGRGSDSLVIKPTTIAALVEGLRTQLRAHDLEDVEPVVRGDGSEHAGHWDRDKLVRAVSRLAVHSARSGCPPTLTIDPDANSTTIELCFWAKLPDLNEVLARTDNFDSLHMDLRYAYKLIQAHGGTVELRPDGDGEVVALHLPAD